MSTLAEEQTEAEVRPSREACVPTTEYEQEDEKDDAEILSLLRE